MLDGNINSIFQVWYFNSEEQVSSDGIVEIIF